MNQFGSNLMIDTIVLYILRILDQNGISQLYNMLKIYHFGPEPSI